MANISVHLQKILDAVYGEEVRGSIHDALAAMNVESSSAMEFAATAKDSAQASAANAQSSASTAAQKVEEATAAASAATSSEAAAENSAIRATQKASEAEESKMEAALSEAAAKAAVEIAENARDNASRSADEAAASALSAQQYSGKPPKPQDGTWWIWDTDQQKYLDSGIGCELAGPTGNGIRDITLTTGDHTPGTTDTYTVTMTDGSTTTISVYNGRNGTGTGDVLGISFDLILPVSGWTNGELSIADSRLLAMANHKYLVDADEASREEYLKCDVRARDVTTTGFITFKNNSDPATDLTVNVIRLELSANDT